MQQALRKVSAHGMMAQPQTLGGIPQGMPQGQGVPGGMPQGMAPAMSVNVEATLRESMAAMTPGQGVPGMTPNMTPMVRTLRLFDPSTLRPFDPSTL